MSDISEEKANRSPRKELNGKVEFIIDEDVIFAKSINASDTGIRFDTAKPIHILMRVTTEEDEVREHKAELVWARKNDSGSTAYGLQFIEEDKNPLPEPIIFPED